MAAEDRPILIVDAMNLFVRHFCANPSMTSGGEHAGGVVGFLKTLRWMMDKHMPPIVYVVWEGGGSTRRRDLFKEYKSNRKPTRMNRFYEGDIPNTRENRNWQIATLVNLLKDVPICQLYVADCEADDVIGYLCKYTHRDRPKIILSSDKDFYQLLGDKTQIYSPTSKRLVTAADAQARYDVNVINFCTAKAFNGDTSDNIPGISRVGFKTLAKRFPEMTTDQEVSVQDILQWSEERRTDKGPKIYHRIAESKDLVERNWKLMHLDVHNLSGKQVKQIEYLVSTFHPKRDKMSLLRKLIKEGLSTFDADSFFYACSCIPRD